MLFKFISVGCVGPLRSGMGREEVREVLGGDFSTFKKTADDESETEDYSVHRVHVYYDADDRLEGAEFLRGSEFYFNNIKVVGERYSFLSELLIKENVVIDVSTSGFKMRELGLSFYVPDIGDYEVDALIKSVYVDFKSWQ